MCSRVASFPGFFRESSWLLPRSWLIFLLLGLSAFVTHAESPPSASISEVELGRRIYMEGILASGQPLQGKRIGSD